METVPAIVPTVPIGVNDGANIKVCYFVLCVGCSWLFRWCRVLIWTLVCSHFRM